MAEQIPNNGRSRVVVFFTSLSSRISLFDDRSKRKNGRDEESETTVDSSIPRVRSTLRKIMLLHPFRRTPMDGMYPSKEETTMNLSITEPRMTKLFTAIAEKDWKAVLLRLKRRPKEALVWTLDKSSHLLVLPLHLALLRKAPFDIIETIMERNPYALEKGDSFGMLPLHLGCQSGHPLQIVQLLCSRFPEACQHMDETGRTPLHLACASNGLRVDVITYLLSQYPEAAQARDKKGFLPSEYVGPHPHQEILLREMNRGKEYWDAQKAAGLSALILRREWKKLIQRYEDYDDEVARWVVVSGNRYLPLHIACQEKAPIDVIQLLIESHPEALSLPCQEHNMLSLHLACQFGASTKVVECLLSGFQGAASVPDVQGLLPLHLACTEGASVMVVQALVAAYPRGVERKDIRGFTPVVYAQSSRHPHARKIVELLTRPAQKPQQEADDADSRTSGRLSLGRRKQSLGLQGLGARSASNEGPIDSSHHESSSDV